MQATSSCFRFGETSPLRNGTRIDNGPKRQDRDRSVYGQLHWASLYTSDGTMKLINIVQYGDAVTVENSRENYYLSEGSNDLQLYLLRDEGAHEECFLCQLPTAHKTLLDHRPKCRSLIAAERILQRC